MRVGLFVPCYIDQLYPDVAMATLELLEKVGVEVEFPEEQTCCGQPMANTGCQDDTRPAGAQVSENLPGLSAGGLPFGQLRGDGPSSLPRAFGRSARLRGTRGQDLRAVRVPGGCAEGGALCGIVPAQGGHSPELPRVARPADGQFQRDRGAQFQQDAVPAGATGGDSAFATGTHGRLLWLWRHVFH